jgi:hypothetical protein
MIPNSVIIDYDITKYRFREQLCSQVFKVPKLELLHKYWAKQSGKTKLEYSDNILLRKLMQDLPDSSDFYKIFHAWVKNVIAPKYGNKISYSMHPKMRVHLSHTGSVCDFHRDASVTGRDEQINVYLPFTNVFERCTVWVENNYGSNEYVPLNLNYGQAIIWDGGYLRHGSFQNDTEFTRVSCDFRFHYFNKNLVHEPYIHILSGRPRNLKFLHE